MMKKVSNVKKFIKENLKYLIIILVLLIIAILTYFGIITGCTGTSMNHSSFSATNGIGFIISNPSAEPQRGDIVKIRPRGSKGGLNKRLIAIPGDTVRITNEKVYVNGEELIEEYAFYDHGLNNRYGNLEEFVLGNDEYFVLGDNRVVSLDSHNYYEFLQHGMSTDKTIGLIHGDDLTKVEVMFILDDAINSIINIFTNK